MVFTPVQGNPTLSVTYGTDNTKIASGSTTPGATNWQEYNNGEGIYVEIDTSAAGFTSKPVYVTSIGGNTGHWDTTGGSSVYLASEKGFLVYIKWDKNSVSGNPLTPEIANNNQWHINWMAFEPLSKGTSSQTSNLPTPGKDYYIVAKHSGKALAVSNASKTNGAEIVQWDKASQDNHKFQLRDTGDGDGTFYIVAKHSGKGLAVSAAKKETGTKIEQWDILTHSNHKFEIRDTGDGDGTFYIIAKHSGKPIVVYNAEKQNNAKVQQWTTANYPNHKWRFEAV